MAICPKHGAFDKECKKCQEEHGASPFGNVPDGTKLDHEIKELIAKSSELPKIDVADQLQFKRAESASLKAQVQVTQAVEQFKEAQANVNNFAKMLFEKYDVKVEEYALDAETVEFRARPAIPQTKG